MPTTKQKPVDIETADSNVQTWLEDLKYALEKTHGSKYSLIKHASNRKIKGHQGFKDQIPEIYYIKIYDSRFIVTGDTASAVRDFDDRFDWANIHEPIVSVEIKFELKESVYSLGLFNVAYTITGRNVFKRNSRTKTTKPRVAIREIVNSFQPIKFYKIAKDMLRIGDDVVKKYSKSLRDKFTGRYSSVGSRIDNQLSTLNADPIVLVSICEEIMALGEDVKFTTELFRNVVKNSLPNYKIYTKYYNCKYNYYVVMKESNGDNELYTFATFKDKASFYDDLTENNLESTTFSCTEDMPDIVQSSMTMLLMKRESHGESSNVTSAVVLGVGYFIKIEDTELYVLTERLA